MIDVRSITLVFGGALCLLFSFVFDYMVLFHLGFGYILVGLIFCFFDVVFIQDFYGLTGILARDSKYIFEHFQSSKRYVFKVADRGSNDEQSAACFVDWLLRVIYPDHRDTGSHGRLFVRISWGWEVNDV